MKQEITNKDLEEVCRTILNLNEQVRFVEIIYKDNTFRKKRPDLQTLLSPEETEESIDDAIARWEFRKKLAHKLGDPLYAMTEYEKTTRVTIPMNHNGLILVSMDPEGFHEEIIKEIIELKDMIDWNSNNNHKSL